MPLSVSFFPVQPLLIAFVSASFLLASCTPMAEGVQESGTISKQIIADTKASWRELFTYAPQKPTPNLPQTRYCYRTQTDVPCYDSPQPQLTSRLIGYQEGDAVSWIQPGGGSLGVSGGKAQQARSD